MAVDGPSALAVISSDPPDALVLDVMMPGIGGFDWYSCCGRRATRFRCCC